MTKQFKVLIVTLLAVAFAYGGAATYTYDAAGRLAKVDYGAQVGSITYTYDSAGNLLSKTVVAPGQKAPEGKTAPKPSTASEAQKPSSDKQKKN